MVKYNVKIAPSAIKELNNIYAYIASEKLSPANALGQITRIKNAILDLSTLPHSHQDRNIGRYAEKGYKQLLVDNYIVIFKIDDSSKIVTVLTIQYQGRNF